MRESEKKGVGGSTRTCFSADSKGSLVLSKKVCHSSSLLRYVRSRDLDWDLAFCPNCGKQTQESDTFCPSCGTNLRQPTPGAVPQQNIPSSTVRYDGEASTARTLTLVAIIIQAVFLAFVVIAAVVIGALFSTVVSTTQTTTQGVATVTLPGTTVTYTMNPFQSLAFSYGFVVTLLGIGVVVSIIWIVLDYLLIYRNLGSPTDIPNAKTPALILGILQILLGGLIPGVLLIIAYLKIGESINNRRQMSSAPY